MGNCVCLFIYIIQMYSSECINGCSQFLESPVKSAEFINVMLEEFKIALIISGHLLITAIFLFLILKKVY